MRATATVCGLVAFFIIMAASSVGLNQGTQSYVATDTIGTVNYQVVKLDIGALGASSPFTGTFSTNAQTGTLQLVGTVGTLSAGTVDSVSQLPPNYFGTVINTTSNSFGTIIPAQAGKSIYVTDVTISTGSATNVALYSGSTGNPIYGTFQLTFNGGLVTNNRVPLYTVNGSALTYQQSTSGAPLSICVQGFIR